MPELLPPTANRLAAYRHPQPCQRTRHLFAGQVAIGLAGGITICVTALIVGSVWNLLGPLAGLVGTICLVAALWWLETLKPQTRQQEPLADHTSLLRQVTDSRRDIVAAFEIERRRIERDLHDGAQQYFVAAVMKLGQAEALLEQLAAEIEAPKKTPTREPARIVGKSRQEAQEAYQEGTSIGLHEVEVLLVQAHDDAEAGLRRLRETVAGIHPKVLSDMGLAAAICDVVELSGNAFQVKIPHQLPPLPTGVVAAAYFFTAEALTNAAKHAPGVPGSVLVAVDDTLHVTVVDQGPGGAHIVPGGGLAGMGERLAAFGGKIKVVSPFGGPTSVSAHIPMLLHTGEPAVVIAEEQ